MARSLASALTASVSVAALGAGLMLAARPAAALPQHNIPRLAAAAADLGRVEPQHVMTLTVMLKLHDEAALDAAIGKLYDPLSSTYRKWMTPASLARYTPTKAELHTVQAELIRHGYTVIGVDPQRMSIRVRGTAAMTEAAFQTELHSYSLGQRRFVAHTRDAQLTGAAGALVASVAGLDQHHVHPMFAVAKNPQTNTPLFDEPLTAPLAKSLKSKFTDIAIGPPQTQTLTTGGGNPSLTLTGSVYAPSGKFVAFTPQQLQAYYGMPALYDLGYSGKGQTVALIEGYGYDDAESDANMFSSIFDLPAFTAKNFRTVYPEGKPTDPNAGALLGWPTEIALDITSVHTIAPDAKILVVASNGQDNEDQIASIQYVINSGVSHNISSSWENDTDIIAGAAEQDAFNTVLKLGAAQGYAFQFSSGDGGDSGLGTPAGAPGVPSDSPFATAVGGTSILNNPSPGAPSFPTGWGNDFAFVDLFGISKPGTFTEYFGGAGGGQSLYFAKPSWQKALPGTMRLVPDVSALADPYTGVVVIVTVSGKTDVIIGEGGTSLASPLFTAMWAIGAEYAGHALGQAAPAISRLLPGQITDVVPVSPLTPSNPSGSYTPPNGKPVNVSAPQLFGTAALEGQHGFTSALYTIIPNEYVIDISFGTDSSLHVAKGWDDVTGYGEPNGLNFIAAVAK